MSKKRSRNTSGKNVDLADTSVSIATTTPVIISTEEKQTKVKRPPQKTPDELRRIMDIVQSRLSVIIDSLEGDDNDISLKRNVATAVKHLKQISVLLE